MIFARDCIVVCLFYISFISCNSENLRLYYNKVDPNKIGFKEELFAGLPSDSGTNRHVKLNPNDMRNYLHGTQQMKNSQTQTVSECVDKNCVNCVNHMQRFINLFLRASGLQDFAPNVHKRVTLDLIITPEELKILQMFSHADQEPANSDLTILDKTLSNIFAPNKELYDKKFSNVKNDFVNSGQYSSFLSGLIDLIASVATLPNSSPEIFITVCVVSVFSIALRQVIYSTTYKASIFCLLFSMFGAGYGWTWVRLYKEADIKRFATRVVNNNEIPLYCRPQDMSWYHYIFYSFDHEKKCEEYFKTAMIEPILEVSPLIVLAETASSFILYPAQQLGLAIGSFITALMDSVGWPYKYFVIPLIIILAVFIFVVFTTLMVGGKIVLRIPFSSFELSSLLNNYNVTKRRYIEDVPCISNAKKTDALTSPEMSDSKKRGKITSPDVLKEKKKIMQKIKRNFDGRGDNIVVSNDDSNNRHLHFHIHVPSCSGEGPTKVCTSKDEPLEIESKESIHPTEKEEGNSEGCSKNSNSNSTTVTESEKNTGKVE